MAHETPGDPRVRALPGRIPDAETLRGDLDRFLELLSTVLQSALQFHLTESLSISC